MTSQDLLVVVNASAGSAHQESVTAAMAALQSAANGAGNDVELARTGDLAELDAALGRLNGRRLVLLGGDGSIHAAVQCLYKNHQLAAAGPIGLIPLGTGNDLAGSLGIPTEPEHAAQVVAAGRRSSMALLVSDDDTVAVNAVHVGIGAAAAARGAAVKRQLQKVQLGKLGYPLGALAAGLTKSGWRLTVRVDGTVVHDGSSPILMAAMGLGRTVGGGAQLVPGANPHDGRIDVVVWESVGPIARIAYATGLKSGEHAARQDVRTGRGEMVEISAAEGETFMASNDGELLGPYAQRRWHVRCDAWQCIVPDDAPAKTLS